MSTLTLQEASERQSVERHSILCGLVVNYANNKVDGDHVAHVLRDVLHKKPEEFEAAVATYHQRVALAQTLAESDGLQARVDEAEEVLAAAYKKRQDFELSIRQEITEKLTSRDSLLEQLQQANAARRELGNVSDLGRALAASRRAKQRDEIERQLLTETDPDTREELQRGLNAVDAAVETDLLAPGIL